MKFLYIVLIGFLVIGCTPPIGQMTPTPTPAAPVITPTPTSAAPLTPTTSSTETPLPEGDPVLVGNDEAEARRLDGKSFFPACAAVVPPQRLASRPGRGRTAAGAFVPLHQGRLDPGHRVRVEQFTADEDCERPACAVPLRRPQPTSNSRSPTPLFTRS